MQQEINHLSATLKSVFDGSPWYGDSVMKKLNAVDPAIINEKVHQSHSIAELVAHVIQWRLYAIEKLKGNEAFEINMNTEEDWPRTIINDKGEWADLLGRLQQTQRDLIELLSIRDDAFLQQRAAGARYLHSSIIEGTIHHDIYHLGQLGLLISQLKR